jgi:hypothetical protein
MLNVMDYDDDNDDEDDFVKFLPDIFPLNTFLNVTGFSAQTIVYEGCDLMTYFALCHALYARFRFHDCCHSDDGRLFSFTRCSVVSATFRRSVLPPSSE